MDREQSSLLLRRAHAGSTEAVNTLLGECGPRLLALIRLRLGPGLRPHIESGDVLQETMLRAFMNIAQFEGKSRKTLMGWLAAIAGNEIRNQVQFHTRQQRDVGRTVPLDDEAEQIRAEVRSEISRLRVKEEARLLERAFEALSESQRDVILLRKYEELSFQEIGERLGKSAAASRMMFARAMAALTRKLRELERAALA